MSRFAERFHEKGMQQGKHQGEALVLERLFTSEIRRLTRRGTATDRAGQRADIASVVRAGPYRQPSWWDSAL